METAPRREATAELVAKYLRALGEPTRLRIVELVAERERSVGEIVRALGEPQPKVSNHLACLRWCGLVESRREHRHVFYRVADERIAALLGTVRELLMESADRVAACERVDAPASAAAAEAVPEAGGR